MNKTKHTDAGRIRHSITNKLNRRLFFRLLGLFISLNIMICVIAAAGLLSYSERKIVNAARLFDEHELPENGAWMELAGMSVRHAPYEHPGSRYPAEWPLSGAIRPHKYWDDISYRGFRAEGSGFESTLRSIDYVVYLMHESEQDSKSYEIALNIGTFVFYFICCFFALVAFELLNLLSRSIGDRRMVRRTLDPIAELARAAQTLNEVNKQLDQ